MGMGSKLEVSQDRFDFERTAVAVVGRIDDLLEIEAHIDALDDLDATIHLDDLFDAVVELAVADIEIHPTRGRVFVVVLRKAVADIGDADLVVGPRGRGVNREAIR
jgi:hypothetical protein